MHLVMFDIDGTLTQSCAVDSECFARAVCETLGLTRIDCEWTRYQHVTDSGIAAEIFERAFARAPDRWELDRVCDRFVELLEERLALDPFLCRAVAGAGQVLSELRARGDIAVALATGGWARSARLKLRTAGLDAADLAFASADDSSSRHQIMLTARGRAAAQYSVERFDSFVYVGDAVWDMDACRNLGVPFIGIGAGQLQAAGATYVIPDFSDCGRFVDLLSEAQRASASQAPLTRDATQPAPAGAAAPSKT